MSAFSRTILDFLFPPFCQGCGKGDVWLCESCLMSIELLTPPLPLLAEEGWTRSGRGGARVSLAPYSNPLVRKLITNYKYASARCLEDAFRGILERYASEIGRPDWSRLEQLTIISVPASEQRIRERGFDHAAVLAALVRDVWAPQARLDTPLKRVKHTLTNAKLEDDLARKGNVLGAFEAVKPVTGTIVLVDDVYTTGATVEECIKVLKHAGATDVFVMTMAKG